MIGHDLDQVRFPSRDGAKFTRAPDRNEHQKRGLSEGRHRSRAGARYALSHQRIASQSELFFGPICGKWLSRQTKK